jgi:hypothetical protein
MQPLMLIGGDAATDNASPSLLCLCSLASLIQLKPVATHTGTHAV